MIPKAFRSFVQGLVVGTDNGSLQWAEGNSQAYFCARGEATVHISRHVDHDPEKSCIRLMFSAAGRLTPFSVAAEHPDHAVMEALYASVVASANHVEDDLQRFLTA